MRPLRRLSLLALATVGPLVAACASAHSSATSVPTPAAGTTTSSVASSASVATTAGPTTIATTAAPSTAAATTTVDTRPLAPGAQRLHFEVGPIAIQPGQNNIDFSKGTIPQPPTDGWVVRIAPNLHMADGSIPGVDLIHLHHGVWLNLSARDATAPNLPERIFAAGEEKTTLALPDGYGYRYRTTDRWILNYMIHNLWPNETKVWLTYDIDFIPATSPTAAAITAARPVWTDVQNGQGYPVFDVLKGTGHGGLYTYPTDATAPYGAGPAKNLWTADRDGVLIQTAGHLHPGGLRTDLSLVRNGKSAHLFSSEAHYYEPAGAVSWDVAMAATDASWRVAVHTGDTLAVTATYDSSRASWYESMGIMVVWMADAPAAGEKPAPDPFKVKVDTPGELTHGHLAENDNHGGGTDARYFDAAQQPSVTGIADVTIDDFIYKSGDMLGGGAVPTVARGATLTFENLDAPKGNGEWHTITACKAPCNQSTGIAYPLADGDITFDSGQLGTGGAPTAGRTTWSIPTDLPAGTYTYFCRIHPYMRGAFRVTP